MKKFVLGLIIGLFATIGSINAQANYATAVGLRVGAPYGFTIVHFFDEHNAIEGIVHHFNDYTGVTALYERHTLFFKRHDFNFYYGIGAGIGIPNKKDLGFAAGVDAIAGLEYTFPKHPFNLSLDIKPNFNVIPDPNVFFGGALSLRYTFKNHTPKNHH